MITTRYSTILLSVLLLFSSFSASVADNLSALSNNKLRWVTGAPLYIAFGSFCLAIKGRDSMAKADILRKKLAIDCLGDSERAEEIAQLEKEKVRWSERLNNVVVIENLDLFKAAKMSDTELKNLLLDLKNTESRCNRYKLALTACWLALCASGSWILGFQINKELSDELKRRKSHYNEQIKEYSSINENGKITDEVLEKKKQEYCALLPKIEKNKAELLNIKNNK